jgi:hypothetical protein
MAVLHGDAKMTSQMVAAIQDAGGNVDVQNSNGDTVRFQSPFMCDEFKFTPRYSPDITLFSWFTSKNNFEWHQHHGSSSELALETDPRAHNQCSANDATDVKCDKLS